MDLFFANGVLQEKTELEAHINFSDRALQYGDGVFETLRIFNGEIPMWGFHQQRLKKAQAVLKLPLEDFLRQWPSFCEKYLAGIENACAKLIISRGEGPRGYQIPVASKINWWLKISDMPAHYSCGEVKPFRLTLCQHRLSRQPALAGLKHLNRLDQIMARSQWNEQDGFDEGIMFNLDGDVIEGTMSNLFWLKDDQLYTPDLTQEGIDGCVRRWIIKHQESLKSVVIEQGVKLERLLTADAVFLTNSLMGIQPVSEIDGVEFAQHEQVQVLASNFNRQYLF